MSSIHIRPAAYAVMRSALALSAAGAALAGGAGTAAAAGKPHVHTPSGDVPAVAAADKLSRDVEAAAAGRPTGEVAAAVDTLRPTATPITHLRLNPLARTPVDPTTNGVGTQVADFKPVATTDLTRPLSDGDSISQLPLAGPAARAVAG